MSETIFNPVSNTHRICPECGSFLTNEEKCRDYFDQMLIWDFENPTGAGKLHHLTVLCYHLQHPSLYSLEAMKSAKKFLRNIIEKNICAQKLLGINRKTLIYNGETGI
jgi:hypothetical protein